MNIYIMSGCKIVGIKLKISKVPHTLKNLGRYAAAIGLFIAFIGFVLPQAHAQVIDEIEVNQAGDEAEIQLHFITQLRYVRNQVLKNGDIRIYVTLLNIDPKDPRLKWEKYNSPPSDIVHPFTVTYPELDTSLTLSFGKSVKYRVSAGHDGRSISIFTPSLKPQQKTKDVIPSVAVPTGKILTAQEVELEAQKLFAAASDAVQTNQVDTSIEILNKLLNLPPNGLSQAAQKLMGEAREKNGEYTKARAEYELYLKLYPKAEDAGQIKVLLANLPKEDAVKKKEPPAAAKKSAAEPLRVSGGISQTYYNGVTHIDTFATDGINPPTVSSIDNTDQSMLLTSLDLTAWKRTENIDSRLVLREFNRINFLPGQPEDYRWNAVYVEQAARNRKFMYRLGRQSGSSGGTPGRFDGVSGGYSLNETWRINAAVGLPVDYYSGGDPGDRKTFTSLSVDLNRMPEEWSGSAYLLMQKMGGIKDRNALGLEAHYFVPQRNYMMQMEYDTLYKKINLATFQGNWTRTSGDNYYLTLDHRRSPPLALNLQNQTSPSVEKLLDSGSISIQTLRDNAVALGMISNMATVGLSHPVNSKLRLVTDFRISNTGGTGTYYSTVTSAFEPGTPGSGNQYALSGQAIGNNLFFENDVGIANATLTKTPTSTGQSLIFTQVQTFKTKWRLDVSLFLYNQNSTFDTHQTQVRPSLTVNYRMNDSWNFTAEGGIEQYHTSSANANDTTRRKYFYVGYRWDFR
jgi:tetratricopeptide (TPR) repeat protein